MIAPPPDPANATSSPRPTAIDVMIPLSRTCSPFSTVTEAVMVLKDENASMIPVVDGGKPIGVVVDRDVALAVADVPDLERQPVTRVMSRDAPTIAANAGLDQIARALAETGARLALVVDAEGILLGHVLREEVARRAPIEAALVPANDQEPPEVPQP